MLNISEEYLKEMIDYVSANTVGKLLKRFEVIGDIKILKSVSRELIYEQFRYFKDLLEAHNRGLEMSIFKFTKPKGK